MATLPTEVELTGADVTNAAQKTRFAALRNFIADLLGTDSANMAAARTNLGIASAPRVSGLIGNVNAATPLTKYDLSANAVVLRDSDGGTVARYATGTITCDLGLAGSAANGRDQAGAFTANSWVYLYFIWNGTTLATIASLSATAPTLPSGYTHYAFATVLMWDASSNIIPCYTRCATVYYDVITSGAIRVLAVGQAATMTAVSCSSIVPPNAVMVTFLSSLSIVHSAANALFEVYYRPTGASNAGSIEQSVSSFASGVVASTRGILCMPLGTSRQIDYKLSSAPSTSGGVTIDIKSFTIPNGDC